MFGERGKFAPPGVIGGKSGALNKFFYPNSDGNEASPPMVSKMVDIHLEHGQRLRLETPGGGGYGNPIERDPVRISRDVSLGYVTVEAAAKYYKCSVSKDGKLDLVATDKMRKEQ